MIDILSSWQDGPARKRIMDFVKRVTRQTSDDYVPENERIAVFDNDGTLWSEQPFYFQGLFLFDHIRELADQRPEWKTTQPFQSVLERDWKTLAGFGEKGLLELFMTTCSGMTTIEFERLVKDWLEHARHLKFKRRYTELVFQPMLELLAYLRTNGFKTFIVSGGGIEFVRTFSERVYGIPPEQVVGSSIVTKLEIRNGTPILVRQPQLNFLDDREGKPVGINQHIGRSPLMAFGNSDGDLAMFEWMAAGSGPHFIGLVYHTDGEREWAYDKNSPSGRLDKALTEALKRGWTVIDMKQEWRRIYPFDEITGL